MRSVGHHPAICDGRGVGSVSERSWYGPEWYYHDYVFTARHVSDHYSPRPTFFGNSISAYDAAGNVVGTKGFSFSGVPGVNTPSTQTITAPGIQTVRLLAARGDYLAYDAVQFTTGGRGQLTLLCGSTEGDGCAAVPEGSFANLFADLIPARGAVTDVRWAWSGAGRTVACANGESGCRMQIFEPGTATCTAKVDGEEQTASVVIGRSNPSPCIRGDELIDSPTIRRAIVDMLRNSNITDPDPTKRVERALVVWEDRLTGAIRLESIAAPPNATSCQAFLPTPGDTDREKVRAIVWRLSTNTPDSVYDWAANANGYDLGTKNGWANTTGTISETPGARGYRRAAHPNSLDDAQVIRGAP